MPSPQYPLSLISGGDTKESGFTKVKNEFTYLYNWITSIFSSSTGHKHDGTADGGGTIAISDISQDAGFTTGGDITMSGKIIEDVGANIASAATLDLSAATGNIVHVTGTTGVTAITMTAGQRVEVIFDGALTLTHHATNCNLPGAANITTAAGDSATFWYDGTTVKCTKYQKVNGKSLFTDGGELIGLKIVNGGTPDSQMTITADEIPIKDSAENKKILTSVNVTATLTTSGANGLDTGTKANNTSYFLWVIAQEDGTAAALWSLSSTSPTMPSGYTYKRRVGWNRTDSSGNIYRILQNGNKAQYVITAGTNTANMPQLASGSAGSTTTPTWVAISISNFIPATATKILVIAQALTGNRIILAPNNAYGPASSTTNPPPIELYDSASSSSLQTEFVLENSSIYWATNGTCYIWCLGWSDKI